MFFDNYSKEIHKIFLLEYTTNENINDKENQNVHEI